jgi:hypothetical protein
LVLGGGVSHVPVRRVDRRGQFGSRGAGSKLGGALQGGNVGEQIFLAEVLESINLLPL